MDGYNNYEGETGSSLKSLPPTPIKESDQSRPYPTCRIWSDMVGFGRI